MINKNTFAFVGILAILVLSLGFTSTTTSSVFSISDLSAPTSVSENAGTFQFTFNLTYTGTSESKNFSFADSTSSIGSVSISDEIGLNGTINETREVTGTVTGFSNQGGSSLTVIINATSGSSRDDETSFTVAITDVTSSICSFGEVGTLEISDFNIDNLGKGSDDEWEPLDEIEIEVEIENTDNDDSVKDVLVEIIIRDSGDNDVTSDFDFEDEEIDLGRIRKDDQETATFIIKEVPADLDEENYKIYIKAYSDNNEDLHCVSNSNDFDQDSYHEIEFTREEDEAVILKDTFDSKVLASCGDKGVEVSFPVYNIGVDKEKGVLINLYNDELEINEFETIDDLRSGKKKEVSFFIDVPEDLEKNRYDLKVITYFDYDSNDDELDIFAYDANSIDDLDETYRIPLEVLGCSVAEPSISANLESETKVGEELIVRIFITNNNGGDDEFLVSISDFEDWAELKGNELETIFIDEGKTEELTITFIPTQSGFQTFSVSTISNGETYEQSVSVNIDEDKKFLGDLSKAELYLLGGIVVLVILIILVLIIRALRKPQAKL